MRYVTVGLLIVFLLFISKAGFAVPPLDPLDSPAGPTEPGIAMFTLEDIFNRLASGAPGSKRSGAFVDPVGAPAPTGKTLNEVMGAAPELDDTNGAGVANVLAGKTFWGLLPDAGWGRLTGTQAAQTPTDTTVVQQAGVYDEFNLSTVDPDLTAANIKKDETIFGVTGTLLEAGVPKTGAGAIVGYTLDDNEDGTLQKGVAWPNPRFTVNNGTVTDNLTGLVWLQNANCDGTKNWADALAFANDLKSDDCGLNDGSGAGDWRLPNILELLSLVAWGYSDPALADTAGSAQWSEGNPFTDVQSSPISTYYYWSSTTYAAAAADTVWYVEMGYGSVYTTAKPDNFLVWPVRAGQ